jgi:heme/copper-type cytochrome/quinol oxidase subunit 4
MSLSHITGYLLIISLTLLVFILSYKKDGAKESFKNLGVFILLVLYICLSFYLTIQ